MPTTPVKNPKIATSTTREILNAIRESASQNYKNYVPVLLDGDDIKKIGNILMDNVTLKNEFLQTLVNRIGYVITTSKSYKNPLSIFKKGKMDYGETIEEIFVNIAKPFKYGVNTATGEVFKRETPDVRTAFHVVNFKTFYKQTTEDVTLRQAFLSYDGVNDLLSRIIESMVTAEQYDEFTTTKYMLAHLILKGLIKTETIVNPVDRDTTTKVAKVLRKTSNDFTFMKDKFNLMGVKNTTSFDDQYILITTDFEAEMSVDVLAWAFNMSKVDYLAHRILIDDFGDIDVERMKELLGSLYEDISDDEMKALSEIPALLVDKTFFQIYDSYTNMDTIYNQQGLYYNHFYHVWKIFSTSPFSNAVTFVAGTPSVVSVTVTPSSATLSVGARLQLFANVVTENFASQSVVWKSDNEKVTVSNTGMVEVLDGATGTVEITATSVLDSTKTAKCDITIS